MEQGRPSDTAMLGAIMRAAHPLVDQQPWIFKDDFAATFVGLEDETAVVAALSAFEKEIARYSSADLARYYTGTHRAGAMLRERFVEEELGKAMERGVRQYVSLGAGYDTLAFRRRDLADTLRVFEVDHPATQQKKQARVADLGLPLPSNLTFVPIDFERQSITEGLRGTGYRTDEPAFFAWFGVLWYLTGDAVIKTFKDLASAAPGSEIVLDYVVPKSLLDERGREVMTMIESVAASHGEPGNSAFAPGQIAALMQEAGFTVVADLDPDEANARYVGDRADGLRISSLMHLLKVSVPAPRN